MRVQPVIMAMEERSAYVDDIVSRLDAPPIVVWDTKRDRYDTGRRALLAGLSTDATHVLVLQDDALPCSDLVASVTQGVQRIPNNPLSLYYGHGTNAAHQRTNALATTAPKPGLLRFEGPWWGVAVCFPAALIGRILRLSDRNQASPAYDKRLSRALGRLGVDTYYLLPSLVDHRLDGPSMIPGRTQDDRRAHHFIGADASALDIDWASLPVTDGHRRSTRVPSRPQVADTRRAMSRRPRPGVGPVSVSVSVMAHPKRGGFVTELLSRLDAPAQVVWDERSDRWDTGRRAWQACDPSASHALVLQDDAVVPRDLVAGLSKALEVVGDNPIGLYLGGVRPAADYMGAAVAHAEASGSSWVVGPGPWWGVGVCVPTHMVTPMLDWCDAHPQTKAYDRRMARYFDTQGVACWYPLPSLVDHRTATPSMIAGRRGERKARRFVGESNSALDIDFTRLPSDADEPFVAYSGPAGRRFYQCTACSYYTPQRHSIRRHVAAECVAREVRPPQARRVASEVP